MANLYIICIKFLDDLISLLPIKVSDYIVNFQWNIAEELNIFFLNLRNLVSQVTMPSFDIVDIWCWLSTMLNFPLHFQSIEENMEN